MAKVLVVGGAGYIGSTACAWLLDQGHDVWVLDDLSRGHRDLVLTPRFVQARAGDHPRVTPLLERERFDCVMHFAAFALVGESVQNPEMYFENNVQQTDALLSMMLDAGTRNFIFSSTCAIFGIPQAELIREDLPKKPINPYGESKLQAEAVLAKLAQTRGLRSIALRYFNAAGAEPRLRVGEDHEPEAHLIPNVLRCALKGEPVQLLGADYPTPDGTCVRDYIHVWDLVKAHSQAMDRLLAKDTSEGGSFEAFNLGSQNGSSVRDVIRACENVVGKRIQVEEKPRRPGDPPRLVADASRARAELGFTTELSLEDCIRTAWQWHQKRGAH